MNSRTNPNCFLIFPKLRFRTWAAFIQGLALLCSGCLAPKSYVDLQLRDATYASIAGRDSPRPVTISVEFQLNGKRRNQEQTVAIVRRKVVRVLTATRVFAEASPAVASPAGQLQVTTHK